MRTSKKKPQYKVGSLFAGMGGFCLAFANEDFKVVWANEKDRFAVETYAHNFQATTMHHKPIEDLSVVADDLGTVDVLTAGFPCQPFSKAGVKLGFDDERGRAFFEIIRLIREFGNDRPKILLFENVQHLLTHDRGRSFSRITQEIQAAGYWFMPNQNTAVLNTKTHTEIPQNRERLYMAALSWDHFRTNVFHFPDPDPATIDYRTYLDLDQKAEDSFYFNDDSQYKKLFEESIDAGDADSIYMLRRNYVRENKSNTVFALMANMGDGGHNVPVIQDTWGIRKLTPAECLRLQGFAKDQFSFPSQVSRIQQYRQIGNAVTVPLVQKLAAECRRLLDERNGK
ncbi:DNA (cytosine-5-)-methyltransferase [Tunturiibacter lichenicola]|uniref:DNA (cytosine-5-)-methyltransferase n=1 Tax=Tunturiibacter lichenicola TaxID=2051959 RepID=UPI003D9B734F